MGEILDVLLRGRRTYRLNVKIEPKFSEAEFAIGRYINVNVGGATSIFDSLFCGHMGQVRVRSFLLIAWLAAPRFLHPYIAGAGGG